MGLSIDRRCLSRRTVVGFPAPVDPLAARQKGSGLRGGSSLPTIIAMDDLPCRVQDLLEANPHHVKQELDEVTSADLLAPHPVVSEEDARLVKAALYLKHGFLDESHRISQRIKSSTGSYWHGIMHRHEGDISNSHYWYDRAGDHPVLKQIGGYPPDKQTEQREFTLLLAHTIHAAIT